MATLTTTPIKTFVSGETVTPAKLNELSQSTVALTAGTIVDADVSASAAIALSKLASITAGQVLVGNASNVPTATALTGDVTVTSGGATAIGSAKVVPAMLSQPYTLATSVASTSGTSIDFTGIPSWAKRVTVMFDGVSTSGSSVVMVQIGDSGGVENTGYNGVVANQGSTAAAYSALSSGFSVTQQHGAAVVFYGQMILSTLGSNIWAATGCVGRTDALFLGQLQGAKTLSDTLTQVRITTANGTDTFDAGTINIAYEG